MKEDECKDCGSGLVFEGSLMSGKMVCRHCAQVEKKPVHPMHGNSNLYNVGNRIGDATGTPGDQAYVSDSAYKGFSSLYAVGSILASPGPCGATLPCDGRALSRQDYQDLFRVVGASFGTGVGDTFRLPCLDGHHIVTHGPSHTHTINVDPEWTCDPYRDQNARRK